MLASCRRLLFGNAVPAWVLQTYAPFGGIPDLAAHFDTNQYFVRGRGNVSITDILSLSRASAEIAADASGVLQSFASGQFARTNLGLQVFEARANKSTNFNANPTDLTGVTLSGDAAATLTIVSDTAALAAAGLQNIATSGKVYKLDNSAGVATAQAIFGGQSGNTNAHTVSAWQRGSGTGRVGIGNSPQAMTLGTGYVRNVSAGAIPASTSGQAYVQAVAGSVLFFILNDLEEGAFVTSPIVIAGASASRAADIPQLIGPALAAALNAKAAFFQTNGVAYSAGNRLLDNGPYTFNFASATLVQENNNGTVATATIGASGTAIGLVKTACAFDVASFTVLANGGTKAGSVAAWGPFSGAIYLGNRSVGDRALNGYMQRFALSSIKGQFDGMTA